MGTVMVLLVDTGGGRARVRVCVGAHVSAHGAQVRLVALGNVLRWTVPRSYERTSTHNQAKCRHICPQSGHMVHIRAYLDVNMFNTRAGRCEHVQLDHEHVQFGGDTPGQTGHHRHVAQKGPGGC